MTNLPQDNLVALLQSYTDEQIAQTSQNAINNLTAWFDHYFNEEKYADAKKVASFVSKYYQLKMQALPEHKRNINNLDCNHFEEWSVKVMSCNEKLDPSINDANYKTRKRWWF